MMLLKGLRHKTKPGKSGNSLVSEESIEYHPDKASTLGTSTTLLTHKERNSSLSALSTTRLTTEGKLRMLHIYSQNSLFSDLEYIWIRLDSKM